MSSPASPPRRPLPQPESTIRRQRRLVVEPVETSVNSNRPSHSANTTTDGPTPRRRFVPELEETSTKSSRKGANLPSSPAVANAAPKHQPDASSSDSSKSTIVTAPRPNKFKPQLIETTRRSRKSGDTVPALRPADKTDLSPGDNTLLPRHLRPTRPSLLPVPPDNTPVASVEQVPQVPESRFSSSTLSRKAPRRHSFRVPDLDPIRSQPDSEVSSESTYPSLSTSPSAASDQAELYKHATRVRESCDDRFSGYLLALAAKAAEKQLREQALAAYPNEHLHEPVQHFAIDRDSDTSDGEEGVGLLSHEFPRDARPAGRESAAGWDMLEMRHHQEKLGEQQRNYKVTEQIQLDRRKSIRSLLNDPDNITRDSHRVLNITGGGHSNLNDAKQKDAETEHMRHAASPPMLGGDLQFPKCLSPQQTKFEVDQYPSSRKSSGATTPHGHSGLWTPTGVSSRQGSAGGLWHGVCATSGKSSPSVSKLLQTGLMTPQVEKENPFTQLNLGNRECPLPQTPLNSSGDLKLEELEGKLSLEERIEAEFNDGFVTQIYNYLSIGYPSVARKYDHELSKISKCPLADLRRDDQRKNTKGYVGAPEGNGSGVADVQGGHCTRWMALRLYIREWARQQPLMIGRDVGANDDWGVRARRGSWAI